MSTVGPERDGDGTDQAHRWSIQLGIQITARLRADTLEIKQGMRTFRIALDRTRHFAVYEAASNWLGLGTSELVLRSEEPAGNLRNWRFPASPGQPGFKSFITALQQRLPGASLVGRPWKEVAPMLGIQPLSWTRLIQNPRSLVGVVVICAAAVGSIIRSPRPMVGDAAYRLGYGMTIFVIVAIGLFLVWSGVRRERRRLMESDGA